MLKTTRERAVAGIAIVLGLALLPVLPAGVPVLMAAAATPVVLWAEGRRKTDKRRNDRQSGRRSDHQNGEQEAAR